jgi:hypothetical protein
MKVKIFNATCVMMLEDRVNHFLEENDGKLLIDKIEFRKEDGLFYAFIAYHPAIQF